MQSTTDPDAQLYRKGQGKEAKLAYLGHVLLDNRHGLVANVCATAATGTGEWEAALLMLAEAPHATTVGGDKHFDVGRFVTPTRQLGITPHVAQKDAGSRIDGRTTRHPGYAISQRKRKLIEQVFGWMKTIGGLRKLRHRGGELVDWIVTFTAAAYNLVRLRTLPIADSLREPSGLRSGNRWPAHSAHSPLSHAARLLLSRRSGRIRLM